VTLTGFLLARVAEDQIDADDFHSRDCESMWPTPFPCTCGYPARVLAECEAKRRIVAAAKTFQIALAHKRGQFGELWRVESVLLGELAAVYSDHPDYREEWAVCPVPHNQGRVAVDSTGCE
jgi:hypothetical protein